MVTVKARVESSVDKNSPVVPLLVPELDAVRKQALRLHAQGKAWNGELFGWSAEYNPERADRPIDSKMAFTPADFCIGESGIWFFSMMWERGKDAEPVEFLDDQAIVRIA